MGLHNIIYITFPHNIFLQKFGRFLLPFQTKWAIVELGTREAGGKPNKLFDAVEKHAPPPRSLTKSLFGCFLAPQARFFPAYAPCFPHIIVQFLNCEFEAGGSG